MRTARRAYVIGRQLGQTNIFFFDAERPPDRQRRNPRRAGCRAAERHPAPPLARVQIHAEALNGSVVLSGTARSAAEADRARPIAAQFLDDLRRRWGRGGAATAKTRIVNLIQVQGSEQVLVRVRVVEMSRTLVRQLGINRQLRRDDQPARSAKTTSSISPPRNGFSINGSHSGRPRPPRAVLRKTSCARTATPIPAERRSRTSRYWRRAALAATSSTPTHGPGDMGPSARRKSTAARTRRSKRSSAQACCACWPSRTSRRSPAKRRASWRAANFRCRCNSEDGQISVEFKPFGVGLAVHAGRACRAGAFR